MKRIKSLEAIEKVGEEVLVQGWVDSIRDHGQLLFIDLRDIDGKIQVVVNPEDKEVFETAKDLGREYVLSVKGLLRDREEDLINEKIPTGKIEVVADELEVLNKSKTLPFPIDNDGKDIDENLRLKYRYIDIRRKRIKEIMRKRHDIFLAVRNWFDEEGFLEVQTPLLTSTSPEGARDFVVPSRLHPGKFFVLPQAPQQYKQLLMVGGVEKYFQIAPCARDEDPRADRHAGIFYQIDIEMSFPTREELFEVCERMIRDTYKVVAPQKKIMTDKFLQIPYEEAMNKYGTDKPDLRFEMELKDITEEVKDKTDFKIFNSADVVKCIVAEGCGDWSRTQIEDMEKFAKQKGAKGLAYTKVTSEGLETGIGKFLTKVQKEIIEKSGAKEGDLLFFGAGEREEVNKILGAVRSKLGDILDLKDPNVLAFAWITDFPFYEKDEKTGELDFGHNPFSMPKGGMKAFDVDDPLEIQTVQYDLAVNGYEILSGSIRNHNPEIMVKAFETLGYDAEEVKKRFGGMYNAFQFGAPPHGGWAIGFDRYFMVLIDEENIRDVYAFPKSQTGTDLMMNAPSTITPKQFEELHIRTELPQIKGGEEMTSAIRQKLDDQNIEYQYLEHEEVKTSEEAAKVRGTKLEEGAKALIIRGRESNKNYMVVIPAHKQMDQMLVENVLKEKIELEKSEVIWEKYGIKVGGVPPFGDLLGMEVLFDNKILENEKVTFNCGQRTASIIMGAKDLEALLQPRNGDWSK